MLRFIPWYENLWSKKKIAREIHNQYLLLISKCIFVYSFQEFVCMISMNCSSLGRFSELIEIGGLNLWDDKEIIKFFYENGGIL